MYPSLVKCALFITSFTAIIVSFFFFVLCIKIPDGSSFLKCPQRVQFEAKYELALTYLEYDFSCIGQCEFYEKIQIRA